MFIGDEATALELLKPALDEERPNERVVDLLAELTMKAGDLSEAERLYELARRDDPLHSKWIAGLARVHLRQGEEGKFLGDLAMLAENDADDLAVRQVLAERHLARERRSPRPSAGPANASTSRSTTPPPTRRSPPPCSGRARPSRRPTSTPWPSGSSPRTRTTCGSRRAEALAAAGREDEAIAELDAALEAEPDPRGREGPPRRASRREGRRERRRRTGSATRAIRSRPGSGTRRGRSSAGTRCSGSSGRGPGRRRRRAPSRRRP